MSIMVWGHRGHRHHRFAQGVAYENSLSAYRETLQKCMGLECDVIQSREGTLYLTHDTLFDGLVHYEIKTHLDEASRALVGSRYIYQLSDAEAGQLKLCNGEAVPRLRELLELLSRFPDRIANLELKGPNIADVTVRKVEKAIQDKLVRPEQIVFSSFNLPSLCDLREKIGHRFKIGALFALNTQNSSKMFPDWPNAPQDASYIPFKLQDNVLQREDVRRLQPDYFHLERGSVNSEVVEAITQNFQQSKVILWTAGEPHPAQSRALVDTIKDIASSGILYAVITDFPDVIQEILIQEGLDIKRP